MAVRGRSLLALALWSSSLWQPLAAQDGFDPQESIPVTITVTSWSLLPSTSTSSSGQSSVAGSPSSAGIPTTTTSASSTVNDRAPLHREWELRLPGDSSLSNPASQSSAAASPSSPISSIQASGSSTGTDNPSTPLVGTPVAGSSSASVAAVSGSASTSVTPVAVITPAASSSARAFSTDVAGLYPVIQSWIKTPDPPRATAVINAINEQDPPRNDSCKDKKQTGSLDDDTECAGFWMWKIKSNVEDTTKNDDHDEDTVKDANNILEDKVKPEVNNLGFTLGKPPGINPSPPGLPDLPDLPGPPSTPESPDSPDTNSPDDPDTSNPDDPDTSSPDVPDSPAPANPNEPNEPTNSPSPTPTTTSTPTSSRIPLCSIGCTACTDDNGALSTPSSDSPTDDSRKRALPSPGGGGETPTA